MSAQGSSNDGLDEKQTTGENDNWSASKFMINQDKTPGRLPTQKSNLKQSHRSFIIK